MSESVCLNLLKARIDLIIDPIITDNQEIVTELMCDFYSNSELLNQLIPIKQINTNEIGTSASNFNNFSVLNVPEVSSSLNISSVTPDNHQTVANIMHTYQRNKESLNLANDIESCEIINESNSFLENNQIST